MHINVRPWPISDELACDDTVWNWVNLILCKFDFRIDDKRIQNRPILLLLLWISYWQRCFVSILQWIWMNCLLLIGRKMRAIINIESCLIVEDCVIRLVIWFVFGLLYRTKTTFEHKYTIYLWRVVLYILQIMWQWIRNIQCTTRVVYLIFLSMLYSLRILWEQYSFWFSNNEKKYRKI